MIFSVKVEKFEGPLDLLLQLVNAHQYDIFNLPIHQVTEQYLHHLNLIKEKNFDDIGEFFVMASTLLAIKSKMLLPHSSLDLDQEEEDPREKLAQKLLELQNFKKAALYMRTKPELGFDTFSSEVSPFSYQEEEQKPEKVEDPEEGEFEFENVSIFKLIQTFHLVSTRVKRAIYLLETELVSIKATVKKMVEYLSVQKRAHYSYFLPAMPKPTERVVSFLSILELAKMGLVVFFQESVFTDIFIESTEKIVDLDSQALDWE